MRECKTNYGTKMGSGRRGDQTYQGNSGYAPRFHRNFQKTTSSWDREGSGDREDQCINEESSNETSPCCFADQGEIAERGEEEMDEEIYLDIIVDSGAARSTMSFKQ